MIDTTALASTARAVALAAGAAIMEIYTSGDFGAEAKADDSPLTLADRAAHNVIAAQLADTGLPLLSEEGRAIPYAERKDWHYYWLIDPLDGTKEFIKRNGEFTVNIALIHEQRAVLGVVYAPVLGVLYWGIAGQGAWRQEGDTEPTPMRIAPSQAVRHIVASRSHLSAETAEYIAQYPGAETISMGSSLKFMLVAEGKAQLYPRFAPTMEWDTAAAQAIVEAAGGQVLMHPEGTPMLYNREEMLNGWFRCIGV